MIVVRRDLKYSTQLKAKQDERIGKLSAVASFVCLVAFGIFLYLAISSQFSEQKTTYYIIAFLSLVGVCLTAASCVVKLRAASATRTLQKAFSIPSMRFAASMQSLQSGGANNMDNFVSIAPSQYRHDQRFRVP